MNALVTFFVHTEAGHWIVYAVLSVAIGSLAAPTKDSGPFYLWFFRFCNGVLALNPQRALNTRVENSPNWKDAVDKHLSEMEVGASLPTPRDSTHGAA